MEEPPYLPSQRILSVGEGNFTFSHALMSRWSEADASNDFTNLICTSYESKERLDELYGDVVQRATSELHTAGCAVFHEVDATAIAETLPAREDGKERRFDRILFQFPLALYLSASEKSVANHEAVKRNRQLLSSFLRSAVAFLSNDGEVHISSKVDTPYRDWEIQRIEADIGEHERISCMDQFSFHASTYPGYIPTNIRNGKSFAVEDKQRPCKAVTYVFRVTEKAPEEAEKRPDDPLSCKICKVKCANDDELRSHLAGKRHKRKRYLEELWG